MHLLKKKLFFGIISKTIQERISFIWQSIFLFFIKTACNYLHTTTLGLLQLRNGIISKYLLKRSTEKDWGKENVNKSCFLNQNVEIFVASTKNSTNIKNYGKFVFVYRIFVEVFIPPMQKYISSQMLKSSAE